jgi:hypothetical protein
MTYGRGRTTGILRNRWHRMVVMQSLRMMVLSGVVRRAEVDPPRHLNDAADIQAVPEASLPSSLPVNYGEQGWFTRFFRRRAHSSYTHARHTI